MRALTLVPGRSGTARLDEWPEPPPDEGEVLVETRLAGVCGTDAEILAAEYGAAPPGEERLVLGHESLGRVLDAPPGCGLARGDWVVAMVRHPDPVPCSSCAVGEWDMCRNGRYTEHGIHARHGFMRERFRAAPGRLVRLDAALGARGVLLEPASVVAKAWDHVERIGRRARWEPRRALVTGAGPIGLRAALLARQRGLEVDVLDRNEDGPKPELARRLGARYHTSGAAELARAADVVIECTGAASVVLDVMCGSGPSAIVCLTGVGPKGRVRPVDLGALNRGLVLENGVVFGSVNANRRHYELGADALSRAEAAWLDALVTRRVPLERWADALERRPDDVKVVLEVAAT
jgi:threonine dehydrogenase-like Zn-dependent dehydrogenase